MVQTIVGKDASQFYFFSVCQAMPAGQYKRWELGSEIGNFEARQNKTRSFDNMIVSYFQRVRPQCKVEKFYTTGTQKNSDAFSEDGLCEHCNTVFEAMEC